jgi:hypothetical protein
VSRTVSAILELFTSPGANVQIPTEGGHLFRLEAGHRSDLKPATIPI